MYTCTICSYTTLPLVGEITALTCFLPPHQLFNSAGIPFQLKFRTSVFLRWWPRSRWKSTKSATQRLAAFERLFWTPLPSRQDWDCYNPDTFHILKVSVICQEHTPSLVVYICSGCTISFPVITRHQWHQSQTVNTLSQVVVKITSPSMKILASNIYHTTCTTVIIPPK